MKELKKYKNRNLKYDLKKEYIKMLDNPAFKKLVTKLKIPEEVAMKYTSDLERAAIEFENCQNTKNIHECKNPVKGYHYFPRYENNRLYFDYKACPYLLELEAKENANTTLINLPSELRRAKMSDIYKDDLKRKDIILWLTKFYKEFQEDRNINGLYLHGSFGSGKTYMVTALLNELSLLNVNVVAAYYPEILRTLKESFDTAGGFNNRMNMLKNADILFLDDIGAESVTQWNRDEILGTILQHRMDNKLPTFFTSNLTIKELETHFAGSSYKTEKVKARRIIERISFLTDELSLISKNRRK